jgi:hypothetical protein
MIEIAPVAKSVAFARVVGAGARPMPRSPALISAISLADIAIAAVPPAKAEIIAPVEKRQAEEMAVVLAAICIGVIAITIYIFLAVRAAAIAPAALALRVEIVGGSVFLARVVGAFVLVPAAIVRAPFDILGACKRSAEKRDDEGCSESSHGVLLSARRRTRAVDSVAVSISAAAIPTVSVSPAVAAVPMAAVPVPMPAIVTSVVTG